VRNSSRAADRPTFANAYGEITAGRIPSFTSVKPKIASSSQTTMSQTAARPAPPPSAAPWMRPMSGTGRVSSAENIRAIARASRTFSSCVYDTIFDIHVRSAPAQNSLPAPPRTTQRTLRSFAVDSAQRVSSSMTCSLKALRTSGRLSVRYSTAPSRRVVMNS
jgi:hypothetical protein